jgi:hypothetical protein
VPGSILSKDIAGLFLCVLETPGVSEKRVSKLRVCTAQYPRVRRAGLLRNHYHRGKLFLVRIQVPRYLKQRKEPLRQLSGVVLLFTACYISVGSAVASSCKQRASSMCPAARS